MVSHVSIWGDWAAHFTMGSAMAYRHLLLETSPFLIGAPFSYPFVANLISAILIDRGNDFFLSFIIPSAIASVVIVYALFGFYKVLFKSMATAILATTIYLCNGGLGFIQFIKDVLNSPQPLVTILNPPVEYTHLSEWHIEWISVIYSMIIPQRAFTLGFPIALVILLLLFKVFFKNEYHGRKKYCILIITGLLTGGLTLIHSHSFLALAIIIPCWGLALLINNKNKKEILIDWLVWLSSLVFLALPLVTTFLAKNVSNDFFSFYPGWFAQEKDISWLLFWLNNWGVTPILALLGYMTLIRTEKSKKLQLTKVLLFLPFFIIFILLNLFLFQPFIWDNTKLLAWASVGISGLAGYYLYYLVKKASRFKKNSLRFLVCFAVFLLFTITIFSGFIDALRVVRFDLHTYQMYSKEELQLAEWVKTNTSSESIWLTGDQHNNWLYNLTGRQPLMTFRGWLWTHGYVYLPIEADTGALFLNPSPELIKKYNISYALIGNNEREVWHAKELTFIQRFPIVKQSGEYTIYDLRNGRN